MHLRESEATGARPLVSVILPTFNRAHYIAAALDSVFAQTYGPLEVIVINDGSTDGTLHVLAAYADRAKVISQPNSGKSAGINRAMQEVTGDFVWIMDDDDIAPRGALEALAGALIAAPEAGLSYGRMIKFRDEPAESWEVHYQPDDRLFFPRIMDDCFITGHPCALFRRSALDGVVPLRKEVTTSVDYNMLLEVGRRWPAVAVPVVVLHQRQHSGLRGPKGAEYSEAARDEKWRRSDAALLRRLLEDMTLAEVVFRPRDDELADPAVRREALLQKASIAQRKQLKDIALPALAEGLAIAPNQPLTPAERYILSRMLGCRYSPMDVYTDPSIIAEIRRIAVTRPDRVEVLAWIGRALLQRIRVALRGRKFREVRDAARAYGRLCASPAEAVAGLKLVLLR